MKTRLIAILLITLTSNFSFAECDNLLDYETTKLRTDEKLDLCEAYQGKVIVMVNTASQCGYTPQFKTLEALYQRYKDQGLVVLGFPSNDFNQEHKEEEKTAEVCYVNYGVTFQMLSTSSVKGDNANPVFKSLANQTGQAPGWNFSKYVINREGKAIAAYSSSELPLGGDLEATVVKALAMK